MFELLTREVVVSASGPLWGVVLTSIGLIWIGIVKLYSLITRP